MTEVLLSTPVVWVSAFDGTLGEGLCNDTDSAPTRRAAFGKSTGTDRAGGERSPIPAATTVPPPAHTSQNSVESRRHTRPIVIGILEGVYVRLSGLHDLTQAPGIHPLMTSRSNSTATER